MDFAEIYHFLFETYLGMGVLIAATLVICVIVAAILEVRTRKRYQDRGERSAEDEWTLFGDDEDEDEKSAD